jgi:hypothetical protein
MNRFFLLIASLLLLLFSCKKSEERACLKRSGSSAIRIVNPGEFSKLNLKEHLIFVLVQDTADYVVLKGGKNLLGFVEFEIIDKELVITNNNKCKFLRYKTGDIEVEIHFKFIDRVIFQGTEQLTNRGTWNFDNLMFVLSDSGGSMTVKNLVGNSFNVVNPHGWGDVTISGNTNYFRAEMAGNGYFDSRDFTINDSVSIISNSSTISKVNIDNCKLKAQLKAAGDLWYYGYPSQIFKQELGSGKLIDMN